MQHLRRFGGLFIDASGAVSYRGDSHQSLLVTVMRPFQKATAALLLAVIGLPASLGVGLHWLQDACRSESLAAQTACGPNCPYEHHAPADTDQASADEHCLLCDFLANAKESVHGELPSVTLDRLPIVSCDYVCHFVNDELPLSVLPRGPPAKTHA